MKYGKLLLAMGVAGMLTLFYNERVVAQDLQPMEDDPMAYIYTEDELFAAEGDFSQEGNREASEYIPFEKLIHNEKFNGTTPRMGIDVSYYQQTIDWNKVKKAGVEYVIIRVGYRGTQYGSLREDINFKTYMKGALDAGLKVGVYIFSQAITEKEAVEEANFVLDRIKDYKIELPVVIDYEFGGSGSRMSLANLSKEAKTKINEAFCKRVKEAGYTPMIYANKVMLEDGMDGKALGEKYEIWLAHYTNRTTYANHYDFWQYSSRGKIDGISTNVDMNVWYDDSEYLLVKEENAKAYVTQVYNAFLGRQPDTGGLTTYVKALTEGKMTASQVVASIIESSEFKSKKYTDEEFVKLAYKGMLGREITEKELASPMSYLEKGVSRRFVLSEISKSQEFTTFCAKNIMEKGWISVYENRDIDPNFTEYVTRCYENILGRKADVPGLNTWTGNLLNGKGGVDIVKSFVNSKEFRNKNYTNREYVQRMYLAMLGRTPDATGWASWETKMNQGVSPLYIVKGFCGSAEFKNLCAKYGMETGTITLTEDRDQNIQITGFVTRCYETALGRKPEVTGLNRWCRQLLRKEITPEKVALGFVFSDEAKVKFASNEAFVEMLYRICLGREADGAGRANWVRRLEKGESRIGIFLGFANSDEFKAIVKSYGL